MTNDEKEIIRLKECLIALCEAVIEDGTMRDGEWGHLTTKEKARQIKATLEKD